MPITIPDNIKDINADAAMYIFLSRLKLVVGIDNELAEKIARWMADAYRAGWTDGVNQFKGFSKYIE